jgi:hypothetical protein
MKSNFGKNLFDMLLRMTELAIKVTLPSPFV